MIEPSWRKPVGALLILMIVLLWTVLFASAVKFLASSGIKRHMKT